MNPKIKFSNWYWKFPDNIKDGTIVKLIQALKINFKDLSKDMIMYDATYTRNHKVSEYKLPETDLILLFLREKPNSIFTTIRRYTPEKWNYYKSLEGRLIELEIEPCCFHGE